MGQRHNRRRTRPRSRNRASSFGSVRSNSSHFEFAPSATASYSVDHHWESAILEPLAHTRHTWSEGWQTFDPINSVDAEQLAVQQQYRYFGGEPGDDENLCYNMLDYFGRLDYINT